MAWSKFHIEKERYWTDMAARKRKIKDFASDEAGSVYQISTHCIVSVLVREGHFSLHLRIVANFRLLA